MFIFNISLKKNKIFKILVFILIVIIIISLILGIHSLMRRSSKRTNINYDMSQTDIAEILPENYTNILKDSYANLDAYAGKKIKFSGFVYRLYDFSENQFVLGREMIVSRASETTAKVVVVGFLCTASNASSFADGDWVEIEGTITKGYYHSELPIVEVSSMKKIECPDDPYVYPPDGGYVKTETI